MLLKEAEKGIRYLCGMWAREKAMSVPVSDPPASFEPNFSEFYGWVETKYSTYLNFKSAMSPRYMAEMWFDNEFERR
jgi:hypothetical protein